MMKLLIILIAMHSLEKYSFLKKTPLEFNERLSQLYDCRVYLKREDQQVTRSFKIRGALNKIQQSDPEKLKRGVVTCSAGNHAQGVAYACRHIGIKCTVYIPDTTPLQKQQRIESIGGDQLDLRIIGHNFDASLEHALQYARQNDLLFIHPFNDPDVIAGQGTISHEILSELVPDIMICPIGGGGLISGQINFKNQHKHNYNIIGVQPLKAPSMAVSVQNRKLTKIQSVDTFVDGASVQQPGDITFNLCLDNVDQIELIDNNLLCHTIVQLYQEDGCIVEPAGALSVACLSQIKHQIKGKTVVCIISGGNNDIRRNSEFVKRSLIHQGLAHYFVLHFPQRPGVLEDYIKLVLAETFIDIIRFEYLKKDNSNFGSVFIGLQLKVATDLPLLINKLNQNYKYAKIEPDDPLFDFLV